MKALINHHQFSQIFHFIRQEYVIFGTQKRDCQAIFDLLEKPSDLLLPTPKVTIPFKKLLFQNHVDLGHRMSAKKIAFMGLTNCDATALKIFLKQFSETDLMPEHILIISTTCVPDQACFCTAFGKNEITDFDLHLQKEDTGFQIFSGSKIGDDILKQNKIKNDRRLSLPREIDLKKISSVKKELLSKNIEDKASHLPFWEEISENCFGCGACTAVCPLCFCIKKDFENNVDGSSTHCRGWDSCFSKSFAEIQNHHDLRPGNINRLYNWYHHKFVRVYNSGKTFLCTGCGRCIKACPAGLNQYKIISSLGKKKESILKMNDENPDDEQ